MDPGRKVIDTIYGPLMIGIHASHEDIYHGWVNMMHGYRTCIYGPCGDIYGAEAGTYG